MPNSLVALTLLALAAAPPKAAPAPAKTETIRRTLEITDTNAGVMYDVFVTLGTPTTIAFQVPIKDNGALLADVAGLYHPTLLTEKTITLVPKKDPGLGTTTLNITLTDGTMLPFRLLPAKTTTDLQVDVVLRLEKQAAPESATVLKSSVTQLRAQLDECQSSAGAAGLTKVAALVLAQDFSKPTAFTVERRDIHFLDKQQRLLVEAKHLYRLFGTVYLVLTVQNRDGSKIWVLDRPEVTSGSTEIKLATFTSDLSALPPDEVQKLVIGFTPPTEAPGQRVTIKLLERNGTRHVTLEDIAL